MQGHEHASVPTALSSVELSTREHTVLTRHHLEMPHFASSATTVSAIRLCTFMWVRASIGGSTARPSPA